MKSVKIMAHLIAGYPSREGFKQAVRALRDGGADILELQIPFSDPTADGPVITQACEQTVKNGFKVKDIFDCIKEAQKAGFQRIIIMTYANIAFKYGLKKFVKDLKRAGVEGIIIPDLPLEDEEGFYRLSFQEGITPIPVVVINILPERLALIKKKPFTKIYVSLRTGITGAKTQIGSQVKTFLKKLKGYEILAGFGIQSKKQIQALKPYASAAVIGSYLTQIITRAVLNKINLYKILLKTVRNLT